MYQFKLTFVRFASVSLVILLLSACGAGPAQTFGDFDSEPETGAASELPMVDEGSPFADIHVYGDINKVGFVDLNGGDSMYVTARFFSLTSPLKPERLTALEEELVLPAGKSCRYHTNNAQSSRNNWEPAVGYKALKKVAVDNWIEGEAYLTEIFAGRSIAFDSSMFGGVHVEQTRLWNQFSDPDTDFGYTSSSTSVVNAAADSTLTISGSDDFPAFYSVPFPSISNISGFGVDVSIDDSSPVAGTVLGWDAGVASDSVDMALSFSGELGQPNSIVCASLDNGAFVIPDVVSQVTNNWQHALISLARHKLTAVQQGDALLIIRNTDIRTLF